MMERQTSKIWARFLALQQSVEIRKHLNGINNLYNTKYHTYIKIKNLCKFLYLDL